MMPPRLSSPKADPVLGRAALMVDPAALAGCLKSLAHALRTPLGVVSGAVTKLGSDLAGQMSDEDRLLVTLAERSLDRLGRIADTVSLAPALDSGTLELRVWPVNLVEVLRAATAAAAALEPRREVDVAVELPADPVPDPRRRGPAGARRLRALDQRGTPRAPEGAPQRRARRPYGARGHRG